MWRVGDTELEKLKKSIRALNLNIKIEEVHSMSASAGRCELGHCELGRVRDVIMSCEGRDHIILYNIACPLRQDVANSVWAFVTAGRPAAGLLGAACDEMLRRGPEGFKTQARARVHARQIIYI